MIRGIAEGCELAGAALVGGETAEMPGMYHGDDYDLAGFCVGVVETRRASSTARSTAAGDVVIGLASSGPHSNGYSLIRKLVALAGANDKTQLDGKPLFDRLLTPTRIYVKSLLALAQQMQRAGLRAHHRRRPHRQHPARAAGRLRSRARSASSWASRSGVRLAGRRPARIAAAEMYRTFNCGIGMIVVVAAGRCGRGAARCSAPAARRPASSARSRAARAASSSRNDAASRCRSPW